MTDRAAAKDVALATTQPITLPGVSSERRSVPPSLTERYDDIHFLGEGGMGTVYRGRDRRLGRTVALKLLKGSDPDLWQRFLQEARSQAKIDHQHVCRVYEAGEANGEPFIAMQYIEGEPLSKMAASLTLEQRIKIMREISAAVHEAHRLGLIHRDIKPGNILVERKIDGSLEPYIMDFGLAKEVAEKGKTVTGAVLGTPAYMSPEQAQGELRLMDRRSDVYSLGATLYDLIAGQPPFVAEHAWKLLMMVAFEDAPPLSKVKKGVPADLETIVMKCLERDPARRYDSARALADDLQRYLDAEPILARRASLGYVLWKKAAKHKLMTAVGGISIVASVAMGGVWVKARRDAEMEAKIAREFGERVKESELFLRAAYTLPLHDVERERDVVRGKLAAIERRMQEAGPAAEGPGHYALGRGYLALGDPKKAREHLEKATVAGYRSPELDYALGRTLGELYRRALEETKRITNKAERQKREEELATSLRDPALSHLRAATGADIEAPAYVEGLISLYEGKYDEARAKAKVAFEQAPWMYEAKKLEADALYAEGSKYRHDAAFDWDKMMASFGPAAEAYKIASRMGESDPEAHRAECELWEKVARAVDSQGKAPDKEMDAADSACLHSVEASSRNGEARVQRANVLQFRFRNADKRGLNTEKLERAALDAVEEAIRFLPNDVLARYVKATTLFVQINIRVNHGKPLDTAETTRAYEQVLELEPKFTWALNELGQTYLIQAEYDRLHGKDPRELLAAASIRFDEALKADPDFSLPLYAKIRTAIYRVAYETEHGMDARESLRSLEEAMTAVEQRKLGGLLAAYYGAKSLRMRAAHEFAVGKDPRVTITDAIKRISPFASPNSATGFVLREFAELQALEAEYMLSLGLEPIPDLRAVREAAAKIWGDENSPDVELRDVVARMDLLVIKSKSKSDDIKEADYDAVANILRPVIAKRPQHPRPYETLAEIFAQKAKWLETKGKAPASAIAEGLKIIDEALAIHPHSARAFTTKGELLALRAKGLNGEEKRKAAREAAEAFGAAIRENPRIRATYAKVIEDAARLE